MLTLAATISFGLLVLSMIFAPSHDVASSKT
jgi:hypothetical protein